MNDDASAAPGMDRTAARTTRRCAVVVAAALWLLAGCTADGSAPPPVRENRPAAQVSLSFTQLLPDEGTRRGLLRVVNAGPEPLPVTGAGLAWSGYGPRFVRSQDVELAPGQTLDLRVLLPRERCAAGDEPVVGVLRTPRGVVRQQLTDSGEVFVRRMWQRRCFDELLGRQVSVAYAPRWVLDRSRESLDGALVLQRRSGRLPVQVTRALGSVLYDVDLPRRVTSRPSEGRVLVPMSILPGNRCDEHAVGQATAPFTFRVGLRVAGGAEATVVVPPPPDVQQQATALLRLHCERRG